MTLVLSLELSPEAEDFLGHRAAQDEVSVDTYLTELIEKSAKVALQMGTGPRLPRAQRRSNTRRN